MPHPLTPSSYRRAFRHEVRLPCQIVRERDFRLVGDRALDLSTAGMLVATDMRVLTGEELIVSFCAPRSKRWFDLSATVARVVHGRRPGDDGRRLGLSFHGVDEGSRRALFDQLSAVPPASRSRRGARHHRRSDQARG
jgi:c-di-GMP-binding flagellar brake protein YcgR